MPGQVRRRFLAPALAVALALAAVAAAGCASRAQKPSTGPAPGGRLTVVASFYPLVEAARRIGGDRVRVVNLTPAGVEPHDIELDSDQIDALSEAALVLYLGGGFQPAVERASRRTKGTVIDVRRGLPPGDLVTGDPHVWLDPTLMGAIADAVAVGVAGVDPPGADRYRSAAATYREELADLDVAYRQGLARCERRLLVTSHAAFGYMARRYGLVQQAIAGFSPGAEPNPRRLGELADLVRRDGVTTVFTEELVSPKVANALAREAHVRTAVLSPVESLTRREAADGAGYVSLMRANLAAVATALGCQ